MMGTIVKAACKSFQRRGKDTTEKQKNPALRRGFFVSLKNKLHSVEAGIDLAEDVTDDRSEDHESRNDDDGDQNEDESVFDETLAFFFG
jgi:hypothetical protein